MVVSFPLHCTDNNNNVTILGPLWLVMEYAPFGNLRHYLRSRRPDNDDPLGVVSVPPGSDAIVMTEERLLRYSSQIANGMKYLISKEVRN